LENPNFPEIPRDFLKIPEFSWEFLEFAGKSPTFPGNIRIFSIFGNPMCLSTVTAQRKFSNKSPGLLKFIENSPGLRINTKEIQSKSGVEKYLQDLIN